MIFCEILPASDQCLRVKAGSGKFWLDEVRYELSSGSAVVARAGREHNIINTSTTEAIKLYTIYSPPNHPEGTVHKTKAGGKAHKGVTTR